MFARKPKSRRVQPSSKNKVFRSEQKQQKSLSKQIKLLVAFFGILLLTAMVYLGGALVAFVNWSPSPDWRASDLTNWKNEDNLTLLLLGIDDTAADGLYYVDFIQVYYFQPLDKNLNVIVVDPELNVNVPIKGVYHDEFTAAPTQTYSYKQLLNYYLIETQLENPGSEQNLAQAMNEFIYELEGQLGMKVNRFAALEKSQLNSYTSTFGPTYFNFNNPETVQSNYDIPGWLDSNDQSGYWLEPVQSVKSTDKLNKYSQLSKTYLTNISGLSVILKTAEFVWNERLREMIPNTNLNGVEIYQIYQWLRGTNIYNINTFSTDDADSFIQSGKKFLDKEKFSVKVKQVFANSQVSLEQGSIDVINGSGRPGLASKTKLYLQNYNFRVVRVDNAEDVYYRNTLFVKNPNKYQATIYQLQLMFPDLEIIQSEYIHRQTGDMTLVVI